jgi:membrane protease YdiL (CAAX protease family)
MLADPANVFPNPDHPPPEILLPQSLAPSLAPREIWKLRDLLLFLAFIPFALLISKLVVALGYVVLRPITRWHVTVDLAQSDTIFLLVQQCVFYVFLLGFISLLARLQHRRSFWKSLGWSQLTARQVLGYLAGGGGLAIAVSLALWLVPDKHGFPLEKLFSSEATTIAIGAFAIGIAPAVEELVFRGLLFAVIEGAMGMRLAVVCTAILFAGLHIPEYWHAWNHMFMILVVGIVLSLARGLTGSLAPSIILHIGYNSFIMLGVFSSTEHFHKVSGFWMR